MFYAAVVVMQCFNPVSMLIGSLESAMAFMIFMSKNLLESCYRTQIYF